MTRRVGQNGSVFVKAGCKRGACGHYVDVWRVADFEHGDRVGHRTEGGGGGDTEGGYQLNEPMTLDGISAEELIAELARSFK